MAARSASSRKAARASRQQEVRDIRARDQQHDDRQRRQAAQHRLRFADHRIEQRVTITPDRYC